MINSFSMSCFLRKKGGYCYCIALFLFCVSAKSSVQEVEFNADILNLDDRDNIDLSRFSNSEYVMPGVYDMDVLINKRVLSAQNVTFISNETLKTSLLCLSPALIAQFGLRPEIEKKLVWQKGQDCLGQDALPGVQVRADLSNSTVYIQLPLEYLEYTDENWDPPSQWDNGLAGGLLDYNLNGRVQNNHQQNGDTWSLNGNGTAGFNYSAWRFRADWQAELKRRNNRSSGAENDFTWSRYYAYRAIPSLRSRLLIGENYLSSGVFDTFRFAGASLTSEDSMLPPNLRGYAPEISGVAKTNAFVTVSQQGRVLYETQVAPGPFLIRDINTSAIGQLDVRVEEQDGSIQQYTINSASIPYLTRPGSVRFKLSAGRPSELNHTVSGSFFGLGEFSWGVSNGWSLYGGALGSESYSALSAGLGRDLMVLGALSLDVTQSRANLPWETDNLTGRSYRLNYSKIFDSINSQITFAGYRFSERDFISMSDYLNARRTGEYIRGSKALYTLSFSHNYSDIGLSTYLNYNRQTYWNQPESERYSLMFSRTFDAGRWQNINLSASLYHSRNSGVKDDGAFISLSLPLRNQGRVSYNANINRNNTTHYISYYDRLTERDYYQLSTGVDRQGITGSGYLTHEDEAAKINVSASYQEKRYSALSLSAQGGATLTPQGSALHRTNMTGGTRMLIDTNGVPDVPVRGSGNITRTNNFGYAVVADVIPYYPGSIRIDLNQLGEKAEAINSVVTGTLTEGAIGYRKFDVISGERAMAIIRLGDGSAPPFGAGVFNARDQEVGMITDEGNVYLTGINPGEKMSVRWSDSQTCEINFPDVLPELMLHKNILLPCAG